VFLQNTFGDVDGDGTQDSGWVPGGVGGTSVAAPIWASIAVLANARRVARGIGYLGDRFNFALYDLGRQVPGEVFNDIVSDPGTPITGVPLSFARGGSGRIFRNEMPPPPEVPFPPAMPPLFTDRHPFGWFHPAFIGFDLATGWGSPRVQPLLDRLEQHSLTPLNIPNLKFEAEFREAITKTGPLASPGAGFANGVGSIVSGSTLDPTALVLSFTPDPAQEYNITITNFQVGPLTRKPDNRFSGLATASVTIQLVAAAPSNIVTPPTGGTGGTGGGTDPNLPPGTPNTLPPFAPSGPPLGGNELRTWNLALSIVGKIYKSKSGREHVTGSFQNFGPGGILSREGIDPMFKGRFRG
jgi:hypothetical protein